MYLVLLQRAYKSTLYQCKRTMKCAVHRLESAVSKQTHIFQILSKLFYILFLLNLRYIQCCWLWSKCLSIVSKPLCPFITWNFSKKINGTTKLSDFINVNIKKSHHQSHPTTKSTWYLSRKLQSYVRNTRSRIKILFFFLRFRHLFLFIQTLYTVGCFTYSMRERGS